MLRLTLIILAPGWLLVLATRASIILETPYCFYVLFQIPKNSFRCSAISEPSLSNLCSVHHQSPEHPHPSEAVTSVENGDLVTTGLINSKFTQRSHTFIFSAVLCCASVKSIYFIIVKCRRSHRFGINDCNVCKVKFWIEQHLGMELPNESNVWIFPCSSQRTSTDKRNKPE